jgi:hypothetical protein
MFMPSYLKGLLAVIVAVVTSGLLSAQAQFIGTTWEGTAWNTDRSGKKDKGAPFGFRISFNEHAECDIPAGALQGNDGFQFTRGEWSSQGKHIIVRQHLDGTWVNGYVFNVTGDTMSGTSKERRRGTAIPIFMRPRLDKRITGTNSTVRVSSIRPHR